MLCAKQKIKIPVNRLNINSRNRPEVLMSLESSLFLTSTILCEDAMQACKVLIAQFSVINDEKTTSAVFPIEFEIDLSTNIKNTLVNSTMI